MPTDVVAGWIDGFGIVGGWWDGFRVLQTAMVDDARTLISVALIVLMIGMLRKISSQR